MFTVNNKRDSAPSCPAGGAVVHSAAKKNISGFLKTFPAFGFLKNKHLKRTWVLLSLNRFVIHIILTQFPPLYVSMRMS